MDPLEGCEVDENGDYVFEITMEAMLETARREGYTPAETERMLKFFHDAAPLH